MALGGTHSTAVAQESSADARGTVLTEVLVSARRFEESLQDTPVSVVAFSEKELEQLGVSDLSDIAAFTPNLVIRKTIGNTSNLTLSIRGMSISDITLAGEPSIGVYLDGAYLSRVTGMAFDIVDLERIEVLRGPQGTLFGRNTIGGAINAISQKPRGEPAFKAGVSFGNKDHRRFSLSVDTPSMGNFSAKLSFLRTESGGEVESLYDGSKLGDSEANGGRVALRWKPGDAFVADYSFDISRSESNHSATQVQAIRATVANPASPLYGGAYYSNAAALPGGASLGYEHRVPIGTSGKNSSADVSGHTLTLDWTASPDLTVKSISAYRDYEGLSRPEFAVYRAPADGSLCAGGPGAGYNILTGVCANPVPGGTLVPAFQSVKIDQQQHQFTQEIQFIGRTLNDRLSYTTGLYYFEEQGRDINPQRLVISAPLVASGINPALIAPNRGKSWIQDLPYFRYSTDNDAYAAYGDFTYGVNDRLDVGIGLRYSKDNKHTILTNTLSNVLQTVEAKNSWDTLKPAATVSYRWSDQLNTYAKLVTGYRAGGHSVRVTRPQDFQIPYNAENVISYELGWKADLLGNSLRFNGALFYGDYDDQQVTALLPGSGGAASATLNAGKSTVSGVELEATWLAAPGLRLSASYAYLDVNFKEFLTSRVDPVTAFPNNPVPGQNTDISDIAVPTYAPEHSASLAAEYEFERLSFGTLTLRADAGYESEVYASPMLVLYTASKAHTLVNARATLSDVGFGGDGNLSIALWGKNLTNSKYIEFGADFGTLGFAAAKYGDTRSYGIGLTYTFNR
jgi:iron complex outermembrane receptor protein